MSKKTKLVEMFYGKNELKKLKEGIFPDEPEKLSSEIREKALSAIKEYNTYGKSIYREGNLVKLAKTIHEISKFAEQFTVESAGDWFDGQTVQRNMKELHRCSEEFMKVATEVQRHQDKMTALYEDMGTILNRYFEIDELVEEPQTLSNDMTMRAGDRATVDINKLRKHDPTPSYMNKVKHEIVKGKGSIKIHEIKGTKALVSGGDIAITEIEVPTFVLSKMIPGQRISEAVKFDAGKLRGLAKIDKFIASQVKVMKPEKVFDLYIKGNADEEKKYNKIKPIKESPIFQVMKKRKK